MLGVAKVRDGVKVGPVVKLALSTHTTPSNAKLLHTRARAHTSGRHPRACRCTGLALKAEQLCLGSARYEVGGFHLFK